VACGGSATFGEASGAHASPSRRSRGAPGTPWGAAPHPGPPPPSLREQGTGQAAGADVEDVLFDVAPGHVPSRRQGGGHQGFTTALSSTEAAGRRGPTRLPGGSAPSGELLLLTRGAPTVRGRSSTSRYVSSTSRTSPPGVLLPPSAVFDGPCPAASADENRAYETMEDAGRQTNSAIVFAFPRLQQTPPIITLFPLQVVITRGALGYIKFHHITCRWYYLASFRSPVAGVGWEVKVLG